MTNTEALAVILSKTPLELASMGIIVIMTILGACMAPASALILLNKVAVRLAAPEIEKNLLGSQSFIDKVASVAEHKSRNMEAKILASWDVMKLEISHIKESLNQIRETLEQRK